MNVLRVRTDIQQAVSHFPNIETHSTIDGGVYIKVLLQTSVGQMYVISVTFVGYPSETPRVRVISPVVTHRKHMYDGGNICYMHPSLWNPAKHDITYVLAQTAVWLNKHEVYQTKGVWPGPGLVH